MFIHVPIIGIPTIKTQGIPIAEDARLAYMENLSDRIISALTEIGKNQSELARFVGVRSPSVNDWISGKTKTIKGQNLLRAAEFLKVNPLWLAEGKGPKEPFSFQALKKAQEESEEDVFLPSEIDYVDQHKPEHQYFTDLPGMPGSKGLFALVLRDFERARERLANRKSHSFGGLDREAWEIEKKAVTAMVSEIAKRKVPTHIYQSMMDLLLSCPLKSEKTKPTEPMFTEEQEKVVNKLLEEIDRMQKK